MTSFLVATVTSPTGTGAIGLTKAVSAWLLAQGAVTLLDVDVWRENSSAFVGLQRARILYSIGGSTDSIWTARYYRTGSTEQTDPTKTASQQFNDQMYAGLPVDVKLFVDITEYGQQYASAETFLVLGVDTVASPARAVSTSNLIGQPLGSIAPGASGLVTLLDATGATLGTATVLNLGLNAWPANQRSYVTSDPRSGLWVAVPSMVVTSLSPLVPPVVTTTTALPASAYITQTKPVG